MALKSYQEYLTEQSDLDGKQVREIIKSCANHIHSKYSLKVSAKQYVTGIFNDKTKSNRIIKWRFWYKLANDAASASEGKVKSSDVKKEILSFIKDKLAAHQEVQVTADSTLKVTIPL